LKVANAFLEERVRERDDALGALRRETAERLRTEEMLRQAQKMEALGHLTGGIAHDFNNLLTVVLGNLETISKRSRDDNDAVARALRNATVSAERAAALTQQLLAFGRKQSLQPVPLSANAIVDGVVGLLARTLGNDIEVTTELRPDLWTVHADPHQLESALLNLAVNAKDAMPAGGTLTIRTRNIPAAGPANRESRPGGEEFVMIEVADTGTGMTKDVKDRAFEPFFTTKPVGQGTGLGLSQVHGFVTQSGGRVAIETRIGGGTAIQLYLPRAA
jgi:signal transduction histidine kinase